MRDDHTLHSQFKNLLNGFPRTLAVFVNDDRFHSYFLRTEKISNGAPIYIHRDDYDCKLFRTTFDVRVGDCPGFYWAFSQKGKSANEDYIVYSSMQADVLDPSQCTYEKRKKNKSPPPIVQKFYNFYMVILPCHYGSLKEQ
eukprot:Awhi_evm1s14541